MANTDLAAPTEAILNDVWDQPNHTLRLGSGSGASANEVQGNIASGATDSGKPVKAGAIYNSTPPTFTNGQRADLQADSQGRLKVTTAPLASATDTVSTIALPVSTSTGANVASSASNVPNLFTANANARTRSITNDSTATLYIKKGTTASTSDYWVAIGPKGYFEFPLPIYTGRVDGIWDAANGNARTTEDV